VRPLDGVRASAFHTDPLSKAIHQFKYEGLKVLAAPLGRLMAESWQEVGPAGQHFDAIVPVPLHRSRERERGYNQAALLARELAAHLGVPVVENAVDRSKATVPQVGLDAQARKANVKDAFRCAKAKLAGNHVLLVDDVFTTGATLEAAATALRQGGAVTVWAYTLARAKQRVPASR
jgi:ComF family protein